jgi:putative flippase GtrA
MIRQFVHYASVGAVGTSAHYLTLWLLVNLAQRGVVVATTAGFLVGAVVNYALNRRFTFKGEGRHGSALAKFMSVALLGMLLNGALMSVLVARVAVHYLLLQVFTTGVLVVGTFLANRFWTFAAVREGSARS